MRGAASLLCHRPSTVVGHSLGSRVRGVSWVAPLCSGQSFCFIMRSAWRRSAAEQSWSSKAFSTTRSMSPSGQQSTCNAWVAAYFVAHHNWLDHVVLYEDGTFVQGSLGGCGTWQITESSNNIDAASNVALELRWTTLQGTSPAEFERFESRGRDARILFADGAEMQHVAGDLLLSSVSKEHPRRALVFSSVGNQCIPIIKEHWLENPAEIQFDVVLLFYKEVGSPAFAALQELADEHPHVEVYHHPGMKWPNFLHWMETEGGGIESVTARYDYVWVVDDDVRLRTEDINRLFGILRDHPQIMFACPSFDAASDGVWRYFDMHDPKYKLRYTDFVECTAPVVNTSMLGDPLFERCLRAVRTGCFLDFCFYPAAGSRDNAVAIIDAVQCHHPPRGVDAPSEMRQVQAWEDHKDDKVYFEQARIPLHWYWYRKPRVIGGVPAT